MEHERTEPSKFHNSERPTVVNVEKLDVLRDAKVLRKALGFFKNRQAFIDILCVRTNRQRIEIINAYHTCYDRDLVEDIRCKFRGDFRDLLIAMLIPAKEFYCRAIYDALNGPGTDEDTLVQILVTLSNPDMAFVNQMYSKLFGKTLESDLKADTTGNFRKLLVSLSHGNRDVTSIVDTYSAREDALELKRAGVDKWGTDCSTFNRILCIRNFAQIKTICQEYEYLTGRSLEKDIKKEFCGDIEDGLLAIIRCANNRPLYFAKCLYKTMIGLGTNDSSLIRLIVTRCEIDMLDIKEEFQKKYGKSLKSFIHYDTSGYYRKALIKLIGE